MTLYIAKEAQRWFQTSRLGGGGGGLAIGFGLSIVLSVFSVVMQITALLFSDTFVSKAPGSDWMNEVLLILGDNAELVQSLSLTRALSVILIIFGILLIERALRDDTVGGWLRGLGAVAMLISAVLVIVGLGFELVSVHALSLGEMSGSESEIEITENYAEMLTLTARGAGLMASLVALLGASALHLGLSSRSMFRHSSTISLIVGIVAILTLLLLVFANYVSAVVIQSYAIANILGMVPRLWLLFIGIMMYLKGDEILGDNS